MVNVYAAPEADLISERSTDEYGSVEMAIDGGYHLDIREIVNEARAKTPGAMAAMLPALGVYILACLAIIWTSRFFLSPQFLSFSHEYPDIILGSIFFFALLYPLVFSALTMPLAMGIFILGVRRAVNSTLEIRYIIRHYNKTLSLIVAWCLCAVFILLRFFLISVACNFLGGLILPTLMPLMEVVPYAKFLIIGAYFVLMSGLVGYFSIDYLMTFPLIVEKELRAWQAIRASYKSIRHQRGKIFRLMLLIGLINALGALPLGIGLIWTLPFSVIAMGITYRNMFGCEPATLA